jgi:hypothetical protein
MLRVRTTLTSGTHISQLKCFNTIVNVGGDATAGAGNAAAAIIAAFANALADDTGAAGGSGDLTCFDGDAVASALGVANGRWRGRLLDVINRITFLQPLTVSICLWTLLLSHGL